MIPEEPPTARWFVLTGGRSISRYPINAMDMVETRHVPSPTEQGEAADILRLCQQPQAVVEISSRLHLPVTLIAIILDGLVEEQLVTVTPANRAKKAPDQDLVERVLYGLRRI